MTKSDSLFVVIFRAKIKQLDAEYTAMAARMRELALGEFGCVDFQSMSAGDDELTLSWWVDEDSIRRWRAHPEHQQAQRLGRDKWYASYSVEVARVQRSYQMLA
ncbi:MAG TPA: antibiotic biosynthesis monooxygenase [Candidatus Acidoferrum sp.]|nr:antibiotic biosynthesis monooxygenase [Candidatus Acidoferrum sp.]